MKFKGISPLVATIMLIAFTLIIAGIISAFVINFTETQQIQIQSCVDAKVRLLRAVYDPTSKNLTLTIYNDGKVDMRFKALLTYFNITLHPREIEEYNTTIYVGYGNVEILNVKNIDPDLSSVTVISARCEADERCSECPAARDFIRYTDIKGLGYT